MTLKIPESYKTVIFSIFFILFLWFVFIIRDILVEVFMALLITAILDPFVSLFRRKFKIPRGMSVIVVYIIFISVLTTTIAGLAKPLIEQTTNFANGFPRYIAQMNLPEGIANSITDESAKVIGSIPGNALKVGFSALSNAVSVLYVLIFAFYLLVAQPKIENYIGLIADEKQRELIAQIVEAAKKRLGNWARGEVLLMSLVGVFTYVGLTILGVPYALPLSVLAGMLEIVPNIGPILAAVPAVIVGFGVSPIIGLATTAWSFIVQQVENYVFVPKVMQKSAGVSPVVTLLALAIGFRLSGVTGAVLSIPFIIVLHTIIEGTGLIKKS